VSEVGASAIPLTLYMRQGCHLCEDLQHQLEELLAPDSYTLSLIDIDRDPALKAQYNEWVPVLSHGDTEICHHFLDLKALQQAQAGYNSRITQ